MFVLEWGPDGLLYLSVGNHNIDIGGPNNRVKGRGSSGIVARLKPDGSDLERLVHGLRVPYSFEFDPFGQLWLLSNGEGNPNRFVRVIDGVDYHCYSRGSVDNTWLAGKHPLAPPCFELPPGANTQLIRYYGAAFPAEYQGSLLLDNWGAHGFGGANRAVLRYVPDDKGNIVTKETFVSCADPHFRPSHIALDPDGNLLVADWYGRDDESDLTGRIWRVKYTGTDRPAVTHRLDAPDWAKDNYAIAALGSPHHLVREKAVNALIGRGNAVVEKLSEHAAKSRSALGAANALWVALRIGTPESRAAISAGARNPDWHVRRLAINLLRRYKLPPAVALANQLGKDSEPAVRVEAALALTEPAQIRTALIDALKHGAADAIHLRYEAAWHLARQADSATFTQLLAAPEESLRLAGLIALDVACYEDFSSKPAALEVLAASLQDAGRVPSTDLLTVARLNADPKVVAALEKLVARTDVPAAVTAQALLVLRAKGSKAGTAAAGKRFLQAVEKGEIRLSSSNDQLLLLELLETEGPTDFALKQVAAYLNGQPAVRGAAHALARKFGPRAAKLAAPLWARTLDPRGRPEDKLDLLATLVRIEEKPAKDNWERLLANKDATLRAEAVRWWRSFKGRPEMVALLTNRVESLLKDDPELKDDLAIILRQLDGDPDVLNRLNLPPLEADKNVLTEKTLAALAKLGKPELQRRAALGRQVFDRTGCTKCHTTVSQNTLLAPSLKGIATAQKADYLVESVLYPSKVIKTGFESETVVTKSGKALTGLVREEGAVLRVITAEGETRVPKNEVDERSVQKVSIMPEGQEKLMSRREFVDLMTYLMSLR